MDQSLADDRTPSRRGLLAKAAAAAPLVAAGSTMVPLARFFPAAWAAAEPTDYELAAFAQSIELALVDLYTSAGTKLSGAQAALAKSFGTHHDQHATAFGAFFDAAGATPPGVANPKLVSTFAAQVAAGGNGTLTALGQLEELAAATWYWVLGRFANPAGARTFASILPVEAQHAVTIGLLTGAGAASLVPTFQTDAGKATPTDYPTPKAAAGASSTGSTGTGTNS